MKLNQEVKTPEQKPEKPSESEFWKDAKYEAEKHESER